RPTSWPRCTHRPFCARRATTNATNKCKSSSPTSARWHASCPEFDQQFVAPAREFASRGTRPSCAAARLGDVEKRGVPALGCLDVAALHRSGVGLERDRGHEALSGELGVTDRAPVKTEDLQPRWLKWTKLVFLDGDTYVLVRFVFLRLLGLMYGVAFLVATNQ